LPCWLDCSDDFAFAFKHPISSYHDFVSPPFCYSIRFVFHWGLPARVGEINLRIFHDNCAHLPVCARDRIVSLIVSRSVQRGRLLCYHHRTRNFILCRGHYIRIVLSVLTSACEIVYLMPLCDDFDSTKCNVGIYARVNETDVLWNSRRETAERWRILHNKV